MTNKNHKQINFILFQTNEENKVSWIQVPLKYFRIVLCILLKALSVLNDLLLDHLNVNYQNKMLRVRSLREKINSDWLAYICLL